MQNLELNILKIDHAKEGAKSTPTGRGGTHWALDHMVCDIATQIDNFWAKGVQKRLI